MTEEVRETEPQCIGCGEPESWCRCEWLNLWQLRHDLGEQISVALRQYWERAEQYGEIVPSHIEALQYEVGEIEATNYPHEKMLAKNATLTAENARLREAIVDSLAAWRRGQEPIDDANLPPHIVALQEAIERREGERWLLNQSVMAADDVAQ